MKRDIGLDTLLELNGTEYTEENGYWYRIEAWLVEPTKERPHGIRYNLTLHDPYNQRILGFDNAHGIKIPAKLKKKYQGRVVAYDHQHRSRLDKGVPYVFETAEQLLQDFFTEISEILENIQHR